MPPQTPTDDATAATVTALLLDAQSMIAEGDITAQIGNDGWSNRQQPTQCAPVRVRRPGA